MTLSRKILLRNVALLAGLGLLIGASLWGLFGLNHSVNDALLAYQELKTVETVSPLVATAKDHLATPQFAEAAPNLRTVIPLLHEFSSALTASAASGDPYGIRAKSGGESSAEKLRSTLSEIDRGQAPAPDALDSVIA